MEALMVKMRLAPARHAAADPLHLNRGRSLLAQPGPCPLGTSEFNRILSSACAAAMSARRRIFRDSIRRRMGLSSLGLSLIEHNRKQDQKASANLRLLYEALAKS
ncbi:MAG: hypothetical protein ACK532_18890, partial [Acidobacteriota bacterium]